VWELKRQGRIRGLRGGNARSVLEVGARGAKRSRGSSGGNIFSLLIQCSGVLGCGTSCAKENPRKKGEGGKKRGKNKEEAKTRKPKVKMGENDLV